MKELVFPKMESTDIECRVGQGKDLADGFSLLLYKDARVDQRILDNTIGAYNWQREHFIRENTIGGNRVFVNYCRVSIWDADNARWIYKEDCGVESNTEPEKGEASDAFKRACFNWGIGRELYTAPFIWVYPQAGEIDSFGKLKRKVKFRCSRIGYNAQGIINLLQIVDNKGVSRFWYDERTLEDAIELMNKQTTIAGVTSVWNDFQKYQANEAFVNAGAKVKKMITDGNGKGTKKTSGKNS